MFFHYVKKGDNLFDLAKKYHIPEQKIIDDNSLVDPRDLVVNQCLLIDIPDQYYFVKDGDNLYDISQKYNISIEQIKKYNPDIKSDNKIYPSQRLLLIYSSQNKNEIMVNGYCYEQSSLENIKKSINYLTYLSIFSYRVSEDATLEDIKDEQFIELALKNGVAPIMVITNSKIKGGFSPKIASMIINDDKLIDKLFINIEDILRTKKYKGLNVDFEYVNEEEKNQYLNFIKKANFYFKQRGYIFSVALASKYSDEQKGLLYTAHDYENLAKWCDYVIIMTYEWGYTYGPAMAISPYSEVKQVIKYATSRIDNKKVFMGLPNYGYDFIVPYKRGQKAQSITNPQAIPLVFNNSVDIKYNPIYRTPYFRYKKDAILHEVHFDDPHSYEEKLSLVDEFNIKGISIWTVSNYTAYLLLIIKNGYKIKKIS